MILIAEKDHFDEERARKAAAAEKRKNQPSRKRKNTDLGGPDARSKRPSLGLPAALSTGVRMQVDGPSAGAVEDEGAAGQGEQPVRMNIEEGIIAESTARGTDIEVAMSQEDEHQEAVVSVEDAVKMADEERRALYQQGANSDARSARALRKETKTLELPIDDIINADVRGLNCRRKPMSLYFSNDMRSMYSIFAQPLPY